MATRGGRDKPRRPPPTTPEGREAQLVAAAVDLAEQQILEGKASSQVITHYLKLGSPRERLERARMEQENLLLQAKIEAMQSQERMEELYAKAIKAMQMYQGRAPEDIDDPEL